MIYLVGDSETTIFVKCRNIDNPILI